jgi:hypothetical protein
MLHEAGGSGSLALGPDGEAQLPALPQVALLGADQDGGASGGAAGGGAAGGGGRGSTGGGAASAEGGPAARWSPEEVVASRSGDVLIKNTLLKADHFPGCQNLKLMPLLEGAPNFRQVC